ncbi:MAG: hypothetical protein HC841_05805 [Verrucomicrobiae bacterium]|nr:hypothetical protein [Verrucomicrobiae bacterium]
MSVTSVKERVMKENRVAAWFFFLIGLVILGSSLVSGIKTLGDLDMVCIALMYGMAESRFT